MTTLRMAFHQTTGRRIVEIVDDRGYVCGVVYPTDDGSNAVHIVSRYFAGEPERPDSGPLGALLLDQSGVESFLIKFREPPPGRRI